MDGFEPIQQLYEYTEKINDIINKFTLNYKIIVYDTNMPVWSAGRSPATTNCEGDSVPCNFVTGSVGTSLSDNSHVFYYELEPKNMLDELLPELVDKFSSIM